MSDPGPAETADAATRRSVDRLVNFSDAVVAVAVTLLALPLVDLAPHSGQSVWSVIADNSGQVITFLFTFYVVAVMWSAHNRIFNGIARVDGAVFWLNVTWLVLIVLLPWFSGMYGDAEIDPSVTGSGLLYWGAMALLSAVGGLIAWHLRRRPELLVSGRDASDRRGRFRGVVFAGYFLVIGVSSIVVPAATTWLEFGIIPLSIALRPFRDAART